jgi:hypothetical protein
MADGASHIRSTSTPSRARLLEALSSAASVKQAGLALAVHPERITEYARESDDGDIRAAYRACVDRGKRKRSLPAPTWAVHWTDPRYPEREPVRIWTVSGAVDDDAARVTAIDVTRRPAGELRVTKEVNS